MLALLAWKLTVHWLPRTFHSEFESIQGARKWDVTQVSRQAVPAAGCDVMAITQS